MPKKEKAPKKGKAKVEEAPAEPEKWTCAECEWEHEGEDAAAEECVACGAARPAAATPAAEDEDDRYAGVVCGLVCEIESLADKLSACTVDVGGEKKLTIVTNAANVEEGSRVVCATVGATVQEVVVGKRSVGGRTSEGMLCDAPALGWTGGGAGAAALLPPSFSPGDRPPERRPRMDGK